MLIATQLTLRIGHRTLVEALDWQVGYGEFWAVLAPNGKGKSTLLRTLAGLHPAAGGTVALDGHDIHQLKPRQRAQQIGWLGQDHANVEGLSIREFVALGGYARSPRLNDLMADNLAATLAQWSLLEQQDQTLNSLSGGERQRAAIAQLSLQNPKVWLLDEPTNHLDLAYQCQIMQTLAELCREQGAIVVAVLHDVNLAMRYCSHALLINEPNAVSSGPIGVTLNTETLSELYRHPLRQFVADGHTGFVPG